MSGMDADRVPVIVGVGQVNDRPEHPEKGLDSLGLMERALRLADADADGGWLADIDSLATVDQISCPHLESIVDRHIELLGAQPARRETTDLPHGEGPIRLLNEAATGSAPERPGSRPSLAARR